MLLLIRPYVSRLIYLADASTKTLAVAPNAFNCSFVVWDNEDNIVHDHSDIIAATTSCRSLPTESSTSQGNLNDSIHGIWCVTEGDARPPFRRCPVYTRTTTKGTSVGVLHDKAEIVAHWRTSSHTSPGRRTKMGLNTVIETRCNLFVQGQQSFLPEPLPKCRHSPMGSLDTKR